jgi:hypothetical protein
LLFALSDARRGGMDFSSSGVSPGLLDSIFGDWLHDMSAQSRRAKKV